MAWVSGETGYRTSSNGTTLLFQVIKAIINQLRIRMCGAESLCAKWLFAGAMTLNVGNAVFLFLSSPQYSCGMSDRPIPWEWVLLLALGWCRGWNLFLRFSIFVLFRVCRIFYIYTSLSIGARQIAGVRVNLCYTHVTPLRIIRLCLQVWVFTFHLCFHPCVFSFNL